MNGVVILTDFDHSETIIQANARPILALTSGASGLGSNALDLERKWIPV